VRHQLVRVPVAFPTVTVDSIQGVGYVSINGFTPNTVDSKSTYTELVDALAATRHFGATILDLRDNGGGSLDVAIKMCDEILSAETVIIRELQRRFDETIHAPMQTEITTLATAGGTGETGADGKPRRYLLLGNGHSASAAEIFLVSLKEGAAAPLMGVRTYGKGVGQTVRNTPGKGLALVTFLKFTSASRLDYHKHGLEPDYPDSSAGDLQLTHAAEKAKAMIPGAKAAAKISAAELRRIRRAAGAVEWNRRQAVRPGPSGFEELP
jgi:C-terminal processing protease CtpA/Prc